MTNIPLMSIIVPVVLLLSFLAYYIFVPKNHRRKYADISLKGKYAYYLFFNLLPYLLIVSFVYLFVKFQNLIVDYLNIVPYYELAEYIFLLEGGTVSLFQNIMTPGLTYFSAFIYIFGFSFLLIFTFVVLISTKKVEALQEYAISITIIYLVAFPFYIFTPVRVTGYTLPSVVPLLYELNPIIYEVLSSVDPYLDNCFPSLHAALSTMAMLVIVFRTDLKKFKVMVVILALLIQFTIFYLGIHWISDFIAGILLAFLSYYIATRYRMRIIKTVAYLFSLEGDEWKD
ncbi:phosphatase PAP2 family protein [Methanolobus sp. ZRKC3]|uniref:phosphatase PAP2 family protein n=1 Tax=Methanolobus sp. ZRKC3 TaxID=3125786 RepID=UPI00324FD381